ncbi:MAG: protein kinase, partial [Lachnospiraceae bacterium]|nr:protein kinase [Lachnospiraceae bacterium]
MANLFEDRYRIEKMLSTNGLSITYEAYDVIRKEYVILRELYPAAIVERDRTDGLTIRCVKMSNETQFRKMKEHVIREAKAMIPLYPIPGVAGILQYFEANGTVYTVAERVEGTPLPEYMKKLHMPKILLHDAFKMLMPVVEGLEILHKNGVVHGRIEPANILMDEKGKAILTGFGEPMEDATAEIFQDATARSVDYAPVEQFIEGGHYDSSVDVYAIAAVLYELVTGQKVPTFYERLGNGEEGEQTDPLVEPKQYNGKIMDYQNEAMMKALSIYHFDRFHTMHEFGEAISEEEFADDYKVLIQRKKPEKFKAWVRYNRILVWGFAACIIFFLFYFGPKLFRIGNGLGA